MRKHRVFCCFVLCIMSGAVPHLAHALRTLPYHPAPCGSDGGPGTVHSARTKPAPAYSLTQIKQDVMRYYNDESEWAFVFRMQHIERIRIEHAGAYLRAHVKYRYAAIPGNRQGRTDSGFDQRIFTLKRVGSEYRAIRMSGYMSATF